jgi:hypothetical protein
VRCVTGGVQGQYVILGVSEGAEDGTPGPLPGGFTSITAVAVSSEREACSLCHSRPASPPGTFLQTSLTLAIPPHPIRCLPCACSEPPHPLQGSIIIAGCACWVVREPPSRGRASGKSAGSRGLVGQLRDGHAAALHPMRDSRCGASGWMVGELGRVVAAKMRQEGRLGLSLDRNS